MGQEKSRDLNALYREAAARPPGERDAFIDSVCDDDETLKRLLRSVLTAPVPAGGVAPRYAEKEAPQDAATAQPEPGSRIGRYHIERLLASGGMGVVYEATQEQPRRTVALKVMRHTLVGDEVLMRFRQEVEILGRLRHPYIAQIYEAGVHQSAAQAGGAIPYFAMELIAGLPLTDYARQRQLDLRQRLALIVKVCHAVHHAHQKGVIHRDLKPANILVSDDALDAMAGERPAADHARDLRSSPVPAETTGGPCPKVLDFGVAKSTGCDLQQTMLQTDAGRLVGTLPYMSPEQVQGEDSELDTRSDVYALGVMLYELLADRLPLDLRGKSLAGAMRAIQEDDPPLLGAVHRQYRGDVEAIAATAMEKDKSRRYQSALDLATDIQRYLSHEPITARPQTTLYQWSKFARRHRGLVTGIAAAFLLLVLGLAGTLFGLHHARQERDRAVKAETAAERRFNQIRELAGSFIFEFHDAIESLEGAMPARRLVVERALTYLNGLAKEAADSPELLRELANGYERLGMIQGDPYVSNLGDTAQGLESQLKALNIRQALHERNPDDIAALRELATSHDRVGDMRWASGDMAGVMREYRAAMDLRRKVLEREPDDLTTRANLAQGLGMIGQMLVESGRLNEAQQHFAEAERILEEAAAKRPGDLTLQYNRAMCARSVGDVYFAQNKSEAAIDAYRRAEARFEDVLRARPEDATIRRSLHSARGRIGEALARKGELPQALEIFDALETEALRRKSADRTDALASDDLAYVLNQKGYVLEKQGRLDDALAQYVRFRDLIDEMASADPGNFYRRGDRAIALVHIGNVQMQRKRAQDAATCFAEAADIREALLRDNPQHAGIEQMIAGTYYKLGEAQLAAADVSNADNAPDGRGAAVRLRAARAAFARALERYRMLEHRGQSLGDEAEMPSRLSELIARCDERLTTRPADPDN